MKTSTLLTLSALLFSMGLAAQVSYRSDVKFLSGNYEKTYFLKSVFDADQNVRQYEDSILVATGWKSEKHLAAIDSMKMIGAILIAQIDQYLDYHGYPDKDDFDEAPRITPWVVIHHSTDSELKKKHFSKLYQAYKDENLESRRLLQFLEREYRHTFQKEFQSYSKEEDRIEELIKELELMPAKSFIKGLFK